MLATALPRPISFLVMPRVYRATPLHPYFHRPHRLDPGHPWRGPIPAPSSRALRVARAGRRGRASSRRARSASTGGSSAASPASALVALRSGVPVVPAAISGHLRGAGRPALLRAPPACRSPCASGSPSASHGRASGPPGPSAPTSPAGSWRRSRRCWPRTSHAPRRPSRDDAGRRRRVPGAAASPEPTDTRPRAFTASLPFDRRLWPHDIRGSEAWARALAKGGVLAEAELDAILRGLAEVRAELESRRLPVPARARGHPHEHRAAPDRDDRRRWAASSTPAARATTRSRSTSGSSSGRRSTRSDVALRDVQARARSRRPSGTATSPMPGYTHLQRAQPVLLAHHLLAYVFMLERDRERFARRAARASTCAARRRRARGHRGSHRPRRARPALGFRAATPNSMDAVSDRDFALEFLRRGRDHGHASVAARRGARPVGHGRVRLRRALRRLRHRLVDHAAEEEPGRGRADPGQDRAALRRPGPPFLPS